MSVEEYLNIRSSQHIAIAPVEMFNNITFILWKAVMKVRSRRTPVTGVWLTTNLILAVDDLQHYECLAVTLSNVSTLLYLACCQLCTSRLWFRRHTFFPNRLQRDVYFVHGNGRAGAASPQVVSYATFFTSIPPLADLMVGWGARRNLASEQM